MTKIKDWRDDVWFWDTEVFPHRWLFCAKSIHGDKVSFSNESRELADWLTATQPLLVGYNCKHYDNYIVKAILSASTPEEVKAISDAIVGGMNGWEIDMGWIRLPATVDLMLDMPTMPSLKMLEGNMRMSIEETSVAFDTEHPTALQWEEVVDYCWHDVDALLPLYKAREGYLESKETLANMMMPPLETKKALNMTNAKLVAIFLKAKGVERHDEREYVYPDNIDRDFINPEVFEFFDRLPAGEVPLHKLFGRKEETDGETEE